MEADHAANLLLQRVNAAMPGVSRREKGQQTRFPIFILLAVFSSASFVVLSHYFHVGSLGQISSSIRAIKLRLQRRVSRNASVGWSSQYDTAGDQNISTFGGSFKGGVAHGLERQQLLQSASSEYHKANVKTSLPALTRSLLPGTQEKCYNENEPDPWPFYRVMKDDQGKRREWPGTGWNSLNMSMDDPVFKRDFRFYMYDEGPFNTTLHEQCYKSRVKMAANMSDIDFRIPSFKRMYFTEPALWPAFRLRLPDTKKNICIQLLSCLIAVLNVKLLILHGGVPLHSCHGVTKCVHLTFGMGRSHELRTLDPEQASLFIITYSL